MTDASELRRLFDEVADLASDDREAAIEALGVGEVTRTRLRSMLAFDAEIATGDGAEPQVRKHPWPGDSVGAYRLVAPIGDGGMGSVWLAVSRTAPEIDVAIKFAIPLTVNEDEARSRLGQERRVLASLDHPGIVPIIDAGVTASGVPFLVLRAIHGRTIDVFARERTLPPAAVVALFEAVADALEHAHERGIVHRDVKPQNVIVTDDGTPILIDFGAARITDSSALTASFLTVGASPHTPAFASPEQERGETVTASTDVYALGLTLRAVLEPRDGAPVIDRRLAAILDRACQPEPQRRHGSAKELREALGGWRRKRDLRAVRRRSRFRTALVTVLLLVVLGQLGDGDRRNGEAGVEGAALRGALLQGLAEMPAKDIPIGHAVLAELAERQGSVDWAIAALVAAVREGEYEVARDAIGGVLARMGAASPRRTVELVRVCSDLGLPGPAVGALRGVDTEQLDPLGQLELAVLEATNRTRLGRPPSGDQLRDLAQRLETVSLEAGWRDEDEPAFQLDGDDVGADLYRLGLSLGEPAAVALWLEDADAVGWRDPREALTKELDALLTLHLRLRVAGHVQSIAEPMLVAVEAELEWRAERDDEPLAIRPWSKARVARVLRAMSSEPRRARELAQAGVARISQSATAPVDLMTRMGALSAAATVRAGGAEQAREGFREAAELARIAMGETSPLVGSLSRLMVEPSAKAPLFERQLIGDMPAIRRAIEKEGRARRGRPWWAP